MHACGKARTESKTLRLRFCLFYHTHECDLACTESKTL